MWEFWWWWWRRGFSVKWFSGWYKDHIDHINRHELAEGAVLLWPCSRNCPHYGIIMTCIVIVSDCISLPFPLHLSLQSQWASLSIIKKWQAHPRLLQPPDETHVYTQTCALTHTHTNTRRNRGMAGGLRGPRISPFFINLSVRLTRQVVIRGK